MKSIADSVAFPRQCNRLGRGGTEDAMENEMARKVRASNRVGREVRRQRSRASAKGIKVPSHDQFLAVP